MEGLYPKTVRIGARDRLGHALKAWDLGFSALQNFEETRHPSHVANFDFRITAGAVLSARKPSVGLAVPGDPIMMRLRDDDCTGGAVIEHLFYFSE